MLVLFLFVNILVIWYSHYAWMTAALHTLRKNYPGLDNMLNSLSLNVVSVGVSLLVSLGILRDLNHKRRLKKLVSRKTQMLIEEEELLKNTLCHLYTWKEDEWNCILLTSFEYLHYKLASGKISLKDLIRAYQFQTLHLNEQLNAVVKFLDIPHAIPEASRALFGHILCVSETFPIEFCDSTAGLTRSLHHPHKQNCIAIDFLMQHGAVPICVTNVAQIYGMECSNPIYGFTRTMHNREAGGACGGAAALVASLGGSAIIGVGMDLAGSLRIGAAFSGCMTLKPTSGRRLSTLMTKSADRYLTGSLQTVGGFLTNSVSSLAKTWRVVWDYHQTDDPFIGAYAPWNDSKFTMDQKFRIGYFVHDGIYYPSPGCTRAVLETCVTLRDQGHVVFPFKPPNMKEVVRLFLGQIHIQKVKHTMDDELVGDSVNCLFYLYYLSKIPRFLIQCLIKPFIRLFLSHFPVAVPFVNVYSAHEGQKRTEELFYSYMKYWDKMEMDLLLTPASLCPAPQSGTIGEFSGAILPYIAWNLFDMPAGIIPVSQVNEQDIQEMEDPHIRKKFCKFIQNASMTLDLPLSVQIVGKRFEEEKVLALMHIISQNEISSVAENEYTHNTT